MASQTLGWFTYLENEFTGRMYILPFRKRLRTGSCLDRRRAKMDCPDHTHGFCLMTFESGFENIIWYFRKYQNIENIMIFSIYRIFFYMFDIFKILPLITSNKLFYDVCLDDLVFIVYFHLKISWYIIYHWYNTIDIFARTLLWGQAAPRSR